VTPVVRNAPSFSIGDAVALAREIYGLDAVAEALPSERDQNFRMRGRDGRQYVLKIANASEALEVLNLQNRAIQFLSARNTSLEWPCVVPSRSGNEIVPAGSWNGAAFFVRLLTWVPGVPLAEVKPHSRELLRSLGRALASMDRAFANFDHPAAHRTLHWDLRQAGMAHAHLKLLSETQRRLLEPIFHAWEQVDWQGLPSSVIHGDGNDYNILVDPAGQRVVSVLDFGDMVYSATNCNLAIGLAYAMLGKQDPVAAAAEIAAAYHDVRPLTAAEVDALFPLAAARLAVSVCYCAWQAGEAPQNEYLNISNRPAWALLEQIAAFPPGWPRDMLRRACGFERERTPLDLLASRRQHLGPSLSISYREPLHIVRGWRQYLYDSDGHGYLDCVNNVAHVGHCHPRVVEAGAGQMARLNTNTRYLSGHLVKYIERITATLPPPLSVVYLVCSGSEANELALRLARAHTGRDGIIVVEMAYHGNTNALIDISPYKFDGPGGRGKPSHVEVVPMPDVYRGRHRDPDSGPRYAEYVAEAAGRLKGPAAFICESALSCAGQVILPEGYLRGAFEAVRTAGGIAIADEVQTGFGRAGSHFWMFETQGVTPDIVTLGKPIGNGHPMGAVITTPEIAASFANGMEYFNTFGGNPVSCAIGLAVLDVIRDEGLQENASKTGEYLLQELLQLSRKNPMVGDVRGRGLFLGFEMVRDRETLAAADREAAELVNRMKDLGVLLSTDGPLHNVIKIKPPMVFSRQDADKLLQGLETSLTELPRS
jgi:4-aminobutyrate aminotransferase-like enzyme/Ser/Thr protein kinase RdoA (MazF antagonist)